MCGCYLLYSARMEYENALAQAGGFPFAIFEEIQRLFILLIGIPDRFTVTADLFLESRAKRLR